MSSPRVKAVSRTVQLLEVLAGELDGLSVTKLSKRLRISKSVVSKILSTLQAEGYISQAQNSEHFRLTFGVVSLAYRHVDRLGYLDLCLPHLRPLAEKSGELVQMAFVEGDGMRFVAKAEGFHRVKVVSLIGQSVALHAMSAGKVWLASLPEERAIAIATKHGLTTFTDRTITTVARLRRELRRVRKRGYATNLEEYTKGATSVGVPIRCEGLGGKVVGAVIVSGPKFRLTKAQLLELVTPLKDVAAELGKIRLGVFHV